VYKYWQHALKYAPCMAHSFHTTHTWQLYQTRWRQVLLVSCPAAVKCKKMHINRYKRQALGLPTCMSTDNGKLP
jgi:hypothetical protein